MEEFVYAHRRLPRQFAFFLLISLLYFAQFDSYASAQQELTQAEAIKPHEEAVPRESCFPLEKLSPDVRDLSEKLLLTAMDREALFTIVGGLKPVSEGFWTSRFRVSPPDTSEIEQVQLALSAWSCGNLFSADTMTFDNLIDGERHVSAWIAHRPTLRRLLVQKGDYFGRLGLTQLEEPEVVLLSIERSTDPGERWRGFGLMFGYPDFAIDFFVRAGLHQAKTGEFIERDFRSYPTFDNKSGRFVYAIPQLTPETDEEVQLRVRTAAIFTEYELRRKEAIGENKPGIVALIRDWFDDGRGFCHPDHAMQKLSVPKISSPVNTPEKK